MKNHLVWSALALIIFISFALVSASVSAGGGISAGPWRDINPTQYLSAGDTVPAGLTVLGPNVPFNGVYVRTAGFGAVGAGDAWAVGGCGPPTASPPVPPVFPFSLSGCSTTPPSAPGGGTITHYDGFSWTIEGDPFSAAQSFYTGVSFCTSPGAPGVGLCSPNGDGTDGWIVGGYCPGDLATTPIPCSSASTATSTGPVALYVTSPSTISPDIAGFGTATGYLTSVFETCHVTNDPNGVGCPTGVGVGDAYAAGTSGTVGVIYDYSGGAPSTGSWISMPITAAATPATIFNSVYMFIDSSGNLEGFAVGDNGVIARLLSGSWVETNVGPSTTTFNGVAVDSGNPVDAWAVGYDSASKGGVIYHFSSGSWAGAVAPSPSTVDLVSVFLVSGSEGWIVGTESTILHGTGLPGSGFTAISGAGSNTLFSGTGPGIDLNSVSFQSSGAGWTVGTHGVILQTSDSSCNSMVQTSSPSACWGGQTSIEQTPQLNSVYENSPSDAWAGGLWDTVNNLPSLIHWDGYKWHRANIAIGAGTVTQPDIYGIYMVGSGEGYAVGGQCAPALGGTFGTCGATSPPTCGVAYCPAAYTWNVITPNTWQAVKVTQCSYLPATPPAGCEMTSVYFATIGPVDGWAVGTNGGIWTYSKSSPGWTLAATNLPSTFDTSLNSVFINNPGNNNPAGWAVGNDGVVLALNCSPSCLWTQVSIPGITTQDLYGIYFTNSNDGWIVGADNTIITTIDNGANWVVGSAANAPPTATWTSVHVDTYGTTPGSGDGWAVGCSVALTTTVPTCPLTSSPPGDEATAWWNGGGWTALNLPTPVASGLGLYSVFTTSPTDGWAVGAQPSTGTNGLSAIFHLDPAVPPVVGQQTTSTSSSSSSSSSSISSSSSTSNSVATTNIPGSVTSSTSFSASTVPVTTTSSLTTTVVSTSFSTMTVVSTPTTTSSSTTISVSTPMVLPAIPGFPWESIIAGIILGITVLAIVRRRKK